MTAWSRQHGVPAGSRPHESSAEIRRLRAEVAGLSVQLAELRQLAATLVDAIDHDSELRMRRLWHRDGWRAGYLAGIAAQLADYMPPDVDDPKPYPAVPSVDCSVCATTEAGLCGLCERRLELDRQHWPPHGRKRFGEPGPDDFPGRKL